MKSIRFGDPMTNDEIREVLTKNLSKKELVDLAKLRGISGNSMTKLEIREDLIRIMNLQEGYEILYGNKM